MFGEISMTIVRFILAIAIPLFAAYVVVMDRGCVIVSMRNKRRGIDRHHSTVPIVSFVLAALAYLVYPHPDRTWMISVPLLDIANWSLLWPPVVLIRASRTKKITEPEGPANGASRFAQRQMERHRRLAYNLDTRDVAGYGGAHTLPEVYQQATRQYRSLVVVYTVLTTIVGSSIIGWSGLP
jgi:hypothetical protein